VRYNLYRIEMDNFSFDIHTKTTLGSSGLVINKTKAKKEGGKMKEEKMKEEKMKKEKI